MQANLFTPAILNLKYPQIEFIHLKGKQFAEYRIIYRVNDCYSFTNLNRVTSKHQLLFQRFENKIQQVNLLLVDSIFANIMADLTLEILLNNITSFSEYISLRKENVMVSQKWNKVFYTYKFKTFIHYLTYSNIQTHQVCKGEIYKDRIYYKKCKNKGIDYFPVYCLHKIQELLLKRLQARINYSKSFIFKQEANICLELLI